MIYAPKKSTPNLDEAGRGPFLEPPIFFRPRVLANGFKPMADSIIFRRLDFRVTKNEILSHTLVAKNALFHICENQAGENLYSQPWVCSCFQKSDQPVPKRSTDQQSKKMGSGFSMHIS